MKVITHFRLSHQFIKQTRGLLCFTNRCDVPKTNGLGKTHNRTNTNNVSRVQEPWIKNLMFKPFIFRLIWFLKKSSCVLWQLIFPGFWTFCCLHKSPAIRLVLAFKGYIIITQFKFQSSLSINYSEPKPHINARSAFRLLCLLLKFPGTQSASFWFETLLMFLYSRVLYLSRKLHSTNMCNHRKACSCPSYTLRKHETHNHSTNSPHRCFVLNLWIVCTSMHRLGAELSLASTFLIHNPFLIFPTVLLSSLHWYFAGVSFFPADHFGCNGENTIK